MSKFIQNSISRDKIYIECECGSELLYIERFYTDELFIGCIGRNNSDNEFSFTDLKEINGFYYSCLQLLEDKTKNFSILNNNNIKNKYKLKIEKDNETNLYWISLCKYNNNRGIKSKRKFWEICLSNKSFKQFTIEIKMIIDSIILKNLPIKEGVKVRVKNKEEMLPKFMDEIGRYHFDLGDGTDIIFNQEMEKFCGQICKISTINPFIDINGNISCIFFLIDNLNSNLWFYTFTLDMVEIIK